jgi:hypothetical protein
MDQMHSFAVKCRSWSRLAPVALGLLLLSACSPGPAYVYKLYPGPARDPLEISVVHLGTVQAARFDGLTAARSDWSEVHLLPGEHLIEWGTEFGVSVMIEPSGFATGGRKENVTLEPGHSYTLKADRTTGPGYRMFFWIEDDTTGQILAGVRKP